MPLQVTSFLVLGEHRLPNLAVLNSTKRKKLTKYKKIESVQLRNANAYLKIIWKPADTNDNVCCSHNTHTCQLKELFIYYIPQP